MSRGKIYDVDKDASEIRKEEQDFLRIDLACGNNCKPGFIGIDISPDTQAQYICNLEEYPWQWVTVEEFNRTDYAFKLIPENSVGEIFSSHYIEHVSDIKAFMEELYRIMIPDGIVTFIAPYYSSVRAMQDFTHKRFISENTFLYWDKEWIKANGLQHYNINCDFKATSIKYYYSPEWNNRAEIAKEYARKYYINVVMDMEIILRAIK